MMNLSRQLTQSDGRSCDECSQCSNLKKKRVADIKLTLPSISAFQVLFMKQRSKNQEA